jgi:hypothetical protein
MKSQKEIEAVFQLVCMTIHNNEAENLDHEIRVKMHQEFQLLAWILELKNPPLCIKDSNDHYDTMSKTSSMLIESFGKPFTFDQPVATDGETDSPQNTGTSFAG